MRKNSLLKKALALVLSVSMIASSGVVAFAEGEDAFFEEDVVVEQAVESADEALFEDAADDAGLSNEASFDFVEEDTAWEDEGFDFGATEDVYQTNGEEGETASEDIALFGDKEDADVISESDILEGDVVSAEADGCTTVFRYLHPYLQ